MESVIQRDLRNPQKLMVLILPKPSTNCNEKSGVHQKHLVTMDKINPKDCQVLSPGDSGFIQFFRVKLQVMTRQTRKSPCSIGNTSSNRGCFMAILVFDSFRGGGGGELVKLQEMCHRISDEGYPESLLEARN